VDKIQVVLDTNILISALRSQQGASYKLLMLVGRANFEINLSVSLILEYEDAAKRLLGQIPLAESDLDNILDYLCQTANRREVFYLWRPFLKDPKDDMVLELAVSSGCQVIITYNRKDFGGIAQFGVEAITPAEFLVRIGARK
jgi:putative PIN family toxin of toxin-antitoxin system